MVTVLLSAGLRFEGGDFIALLAVMAGIKPLEVRSQRDSMVTVLLAYFLVITSLFVFENLSMTLYLFVSVWVTTGVLIHVNDPRGAIRRQMRLAARLVLMAVPLMVLLFLLFPRLSGGFWGSPWARSSRSGFSSTLRIGDVSQLVLVDAPAFSVNFDSPVPDAHRLYWRGIVFQRFDGAAWHPAYPQAIRRGRVGGADLSRYTVILEPHGHRHLFVLDLPLTANPMATIMDDHTLVANRPIRQRYHYAAASLLEYRPDDADQPGSAYLQLPPNRNPQTVAWPTSGFGTILRPKPWWRRPWPFFREEDLGMTCGRTGSGVHAVDDFLSPAARDFASIRDRLHRAHAGCRRTDAHGGGYQGASGSAWVVSTVRHSDAHVWCEVWLKGQGWVRVDPTFTVAPDRIDAGIERALAGEGLPGFRAATGVTCWPVGAKACARPGKP